MEHSSSFHSYLLLRLPLVLTFASGYLVYLLLAATKLTDVFVLWSLQRSRGNPRSLLAYVICSAALLSFFIPNAVTVLTLLPLLKAIEPDVVSQNNDRRFTTALTLSVIYGANIGGMGSLIGSPANLLLIGALDLYGVPGREQISFLNWFIWSVPLVVFFAAVAWALIATFGVPKGTPFAVPKDMQGTGAGFDGSKHCFGLSPKQRRGVVLFVFFVVFWISEGITKELLPLFARYEPYVCIGFFVVFVYLAFVKSSRQHRAPLLRMSNIVSGLPKRGILFLGIVILIIPVIRLFQLDKHAAVLFSDFIRPETSAFLVFFGTTLTVIFLTEILSNTVVSSAFFPIVYFTCTAHNIPPLILMIAVSIASTCAFMTPIATPCNALAFGEMKGTSLRKMLAMGLPLNIIGALLITLWLQFVIPLVYS